MKPEITKEWTVEKLLEFHPETSRIFIRYKLPCIQCGEPVWGTIEEICDEHGVDVNDFINALRKASIE
ncbi:DUF1858 domain-containing protein [bacterium]|nr:DUF1858 domain-containing protein [bacterium]